MPTFERNNALISEVLLGQGHISKYAYVNNKHYDTNCMFTATLCVFWASLIFKLNCVL